MTGASREPKRARGKTTADGPELFIGLVGAVGADLDGVVEALRLSLKNLNYQCHQVRLSELLRSLGKWASLPLSPEDERIEKHMTAGNEFREDLGRGDALAVYATREVWAKRRVATRDQKMPIPRMAYVLRSLKRPEELRSLRSIYGPYFILVAAYCPRDIRILNLAKRIAESRNSARCEPFLGRAQAINLRDEEEAGKPLGQNVGATFPLADVFVNTTDKSELQRSMNRFVELLFGHPFHTPTRDEYAMFHAKAAALRSASLSRQVGAAIADQNGQILALGTNEVPKAGGGLYWSEEEPDKRDCRLGYDVGERMRRNTLAEVLDRLAENGWLAKLKASADSRQRVEEALPIMVGSQLMKSIEYGRAVHAEVAAIIDGALRGVRIGGCTLYTTTFPCHDCARHIVAAGIRRVIYVEPYPKSLAVQFHEDAICVDPQTDPRDRVAFRPFVGIAPRLYADLFDIGAVRRKTADGTAVDWADVRTSAVPKLIIDASPVYIFREIAEFVKVKKGIREASRRQVDG